MTRANYQLLDHKGNVLISAASGIPLEIVGNTTPLVKLRKLTSPPGTASDWRMYISGNETEPNPTLSFIARDSADTVLNTIRMRGDGTMGLGANPIGSLDAATKQYVDLQPRWAGMATGTIPNASLTIFQAWGTAEIAREISRSSGTFTVVRSGAYLFSLNAAFDTTKATGKRMFVEFSITGDTGGAIRQSMEDLESTTVLAILATLPAGGTFSCKAYQNTGASIQGQGYLQVVRLSEL